MLATINGLDLVLFVVGSIGWFLFWIERGSRLIEQARQRVEPEPEPVPSNVKVVQGFTGTGKPTSAAIPVTVGLCMEAGCRLVEEHVGPHMGEHGIWAHGE